MDRLEGTENMAFEKFLAQQKTTILKKWFQLVLETYPPETARLLKHEPNQFANPVGHTTFHGMEGLLDELLLEGGPERLTPFLDKIIRIRAIQDFSASRAVGFVFFLKKIVREELENEAWKEVVSSGEVTAFETKIDELALLAFNVYMECREKLYEIRINEVKNMSHRLLQRANLIAEIPESKPGPKDGNA